ncbi:MAG: putative glycoside hydrolase [Oscillospiraceae bacterium]|nr:putative glycoside hydrolase [Oscillospiraceae bacterium]
MAAFVITTVILFMQGMAGAPGRFGDDPDDDQPPNGDLVVTPTPTPTIEPTPFIPNLPPRVEVRGIWVGVEHYGNSTYMNELFDLIENSILNTMVLDIKNEEGQVIHLTNDDFAAWRPERAENVLPDHTATVAELKSRDIYTIARLACFKDPIGTVRQPQNAVRNRNGNVWSDNAGVRWLNPFIKENWEYLAEIALEAARMGFDEIQLDFVRFAVGGALSDRDLPNADEFAPIITEFVSFMRDTLRGVGVRISVDIFAIAGLSTTDSRLLGQNVQSLLPLVDAISPMIYPSHFAHEGRGAHGNGSGSLINGVLFPRPALDPHGVIYNTLQHYRRHVDLFTSNNPGVDVAEIRPYLQGSNDDFLPEGFWMVYGPDEYAAQIQAVYDAGFTEWLFWAHRGNYLAFDRYQAFFP